MSDIPDDLLPDDPQRIGGKSKYDVEIDGTIFPREPGDADTKPGACDWCGEEKKAVFLGVTAETGDPRQMCLLCRIRLCSADIDDPDSG